MFGQRGRHFSEDDDGLLADVALNLERARALEGRALKPVAVLGLLPWKMWDGDGAREDKELALVVWGGVSKLSKPP